MLLDTKDTITTTEIDWSYYLSYNPWDYVRMIGDKLKYESRFFVDPQFNLLLDRYAFNSAWCAQSQTILSPSNTELYRARKFKREDCTERFCRRTEFAPFEGFDAQDSFVPPVGAAVPHGRANPNYIRYLYTASDIQTCLLEVDAKVGDYISVAKIALNETAKMFDLSKSWSSAVDESLEISFWLDQFVFCLLDTFHSQANDETDYLLCQYVSEYVKRMGFDGIMFRSSKTMYNTDYAGINFTFFNYNKCYVESSKLVFVNNIIVETLPKTPRYEF